MAANTPVGSLSDWLDSCAKSSASQ